MKKTALVLFVAAVVPGCAVDEPLFPPPSSSNRVDVVVHDGATYVSGCVHQQAFPLSGCTDAQLPGLQVRLGLDGEVSDVPRAAPTLPWDLYNYDLFNFPGPFLAVFTIAADKSVVAKIDGDIEAGVIPDAPNAAQPSPADRSVPFELAVTIDEDATLAGFIDSSCGVATPFDSGAITPDPNIRYRDGKLVIDLSYLAKPNTGSCTHRLVMFSRRYVGGGLTLAASTIVSFTSEP
ncbi:MAG: hypothetical protein ACKV2T_20345 [Kofleriaceae bacterium]